MRHDDCSVPLPLHCRRRRRRRCSHGRALTPGSDWGRVISSVKIAGWFLTRPVSGRLARIACLLAVQRERALALGSSEIKCEKVRLLLLHRAPTLSPQLAGYNLAYSGHCLNCVCPPARRSVCLRRAPTAATTATTTTTTNRPKQTGPD